MLSVNVPIGLAVALAAPQVLRETPHRRGRFGLPGAITGTGGIAALVYGLSNAATGPNAVSHRATAKSLPPLLPGRLRRDRNRAYVIMLGVGTAIFGMFFFLTLFMRAVLGCSALKTGVAYLPALRAVLDPGDPGGSWRQEERAGPGPAPARRAARKACGGRAPDATERK